jgi:hypothetical protein
MRTWTHRDRQPFITEIRDGTPSLIKDWDDIHHNYIISN